MNDNMKKGNTVLLTVIAVATLLVAVVGATFAYFTASVTGNQSASSVIVKAQELATITYNNGNTLSLTDALPGAVSSPIQFTVKADDKGTTDIKYSLKWVDVTNEFNQAGHNDIVYTLKGSNATGNTGVVGGEEGQTDLSAPTSSDTILGSGVIKPGETHTYTLSVKFKETGTDQTSLQGKKFTAKIEVVTGDTSGSSIYYNASNSTGTTTQPSAEQ